ncbi:MAG: extracellular solute-binding protein [Treponema sp.]|jgi:lactose/L-arabinose transport system substrate-binding protein|nr:extracellular solute-binding protein [Treponema sp.]
MKKTMNLILRSALIAIGISALISCGGNKKETPPAAAKTADPNAPVALTVWCWDPNFNVYAMNEAAKIYRRDHPNVTVNVLDITELEQKITTALSAGETANLPDIVLNQDNSIQRFIQTFPGAYVPLNGKVDLSKFAQFKLDVGSYEGSNYGVPFDNGATATFIRRDIVEQAGLQVQDFNDITWERFIELGKIIKEKTGVTMISTQGGTNDFIMIMLQSAGQWFFDEQGVVNIKNNAALRSAIETYRELVNTGVCLEVADWNAYIATLNNGTVASTIQGCWIIGSITPETSQSGKWGVVNTPRLDIPGGVNYSSQGGSGWMVMANSKHPETAMDFLNKTFAGSVELYETILPASGAIGTWLPAGESTVYEQPHEFFGGQKIYEDLVSYAGKVPRVKFGVFNYEARDAVVRAVAEIMRGASIDAALDAAQKSLEFIIEQ